MRFILETITGRKGIKNFSSLEEYVDFMTKNGDKIKNIVESDLPYDDKPVSVATPSQSNGWEQVNKATFGDVIKKAEKGDCVLPHKASSVFKDEAKFEPSKTSDKVDSQEGDVPQFKYDEPKQSSEPKEEKVKSPKTEEPKSEEKPSEPKEEKSEEKDDSKKEKKQVNEGFENIKVGDKLYDDRNQEYVVDEIDTNYGEDKYGHPANYITLKHIVNGQKVGGGLGMPSTGLQYIFHTKEQVDEGLGDKIHDLGVKAKQKLGIGLSGKELEDYINEYFVYVFMIANHQVKPNHPGFEKIAEKLIKTDSKMENVHDVVMSILEDKYYMNGFPADIIEDLLKRRLSSLGIDESIIDKAYNTFVEEEKNKDDGSFDNEIEEALRIAGIQLNEAEDDILELDEYEDGEGIDQKVLQELYEIICENYGEDWLSDNDEVDFMEIENAVSDFGNDIDGYDESLRHDYALALKDKWSEEHMNEDINNPEDGEIDEKTGKEKLMEEPSSSDDGSVDYAKHQVELWKDAMYANEIGDDMYYSNGHRRRDEANLNYWEQEVKKRSKGPEEDPFAALYAANAKFMKNNGNSFAHNVGEKLVNNENGQVYKITSVSKDTNSGKSEYVLRNEDTYEDEYVNEDELNSKFKAQ